MMDESRGLIDMQGDVVWGAAISEGLPVGESRGSLF